MKKVLLLVASFLVVLFTLTTLTNTNYLYKALWFFTADIDDYKIFDNRVIEVGVGQPIAQSPLFNSKQPSSELNSLLNKTGSVALLVLKNDSILYEKYWSGYSDTSYSNSFSMAKTIVGLLTACALKDGFIKSFDQSVGDFIPEFNKGDKSKITIRNLLTMSSGSNWDESYSSPFSTTTIAYYGWDLYKVAIDVNIKKKPRVEWRYKSGDTELLGIVIEKATRKSLSVYASEKLWKPLGAQHSALWSLDKKDGREKAYCCFNSNARDFSRIGTLLLHRGNWNGIQILDSSVVELFTSPLTIKDEENQIVDYYGYQIWRLPDREGVFYCRGILGQYIIVVPKKNVVIVRLGLRRGEILRYSFEDVYSLVDWALKEL